jgi:hypothetical protein
LRLNCLRDLRRVAQALLNDSTLVYLRQLVVSLGERQRDRSATNYCQRALDDDECLYQVFVNESFFEDFPEWRVYIEQ